MWAELSIGGAWVYTPRVWEDKRGSFFEMFRNRDFAEHLGYEFDVAQANCSISHRGVIRGIHFADVPPGQAKYVCCVSGRILDVVVDLRIGSPAFGSWAAAELDDTRRQSLFLAEGLGHGFTAISPEATVLYLCSTPYAPDREHAVHALDPDLGIAWPAGDNPILSDRDAVAPTLEQVRLDGLLPSYEACLEHSRRLSARKPPAADDQPLTVGR